MVQEDRGERPRPHLRTRDRECRSTDVQCGRTFQQRRWCPACVNGRRHQFEELENAGRLNAAAKTNARSAPGATVVPSAARTGTRENASTPNPRTVAALATSSDATVSGEEAPVWSAAV